MTPSASECNHTSALSKQLKQPVPSSLILATATSKNAQTLLLTVHCMKNKSMVPGLKHLTLLR